MKVERFSRLLVLIPAAAFLGFVTVDDTLKWHGQYPVLTFQLNPQVHGAHVGDVNAVADAVRSAASMWSSGRMGARFDLRLSGTSDAADVTFPVSLGCSQEHVAALARVQAVVVASTVPDPDCSGAVCTYVWSCPGTGAIHHDVKLNNADFAFSTGGSAGAHDFDLASVLAHAFGHVLGLDHCQPGESSSGCEGRLGAGRVDPAEDAVMYRFLETGTVKVSPSADDRSGLHALYGPLPASQAALREEMAVFAARIDTLCAIGCALPDEETDARYQLTASETVVMDEHDGVMMTQEGFADRNNRFLKTQGLVTLYHTAYLHNRIPAERYLLDVVEKRAALAAAMEPDYLNAARHVITVNIQTLQAAVDEFQTDVDEDYLTFARAELKAQILIRKALIDEMARR